MANKNFNAKKVLMSTLAAVAFSFVFTTNADAIRVKVRVKAPQSQTVIKEKKQQDQQKQQQQQQQQQQQKKEDCNGFILLLIPVHETYSSAPIKNEEKYKALGSFGLKGFPYKSILWLLNSNLFAIHDVETSRQIVE